MSSLGEIAEKTILAIDTSCDDTSVAVVRGTVVLSSVVASQTQLHKQYGGVFPTVAKQAHRENVAPAVRAALRRAHLSWPDISAIAITQGPGLAPALEVGIEYAKQLSAEHQLPLIPVNHIEGHVLSVLAQRPTKPTTKLKTNYPLPTTHSPAIYPALSLVISGGHSEFILVEAPGQYQRLGFTVDDAAGEALDKFGRMVELGYPAGPVVEELARRGNPHAFPFPIPMKTSGDFNLSFSGLKTAVRNLIAQLEATASLTAAQIADLCASFQYAVFHAITYKLEKILHDPIAANIKEVWLGGGVAANLELRRHLRATLKPHHLRLRVPYSKTLCSDNAAMIGVVCTTTLATTGYLVPQTNRTLERRPNLMITFQTH